MADGSSLLETREPINVDRDYRLERVDEELSMLTNEINKEQWRTRHAAQGKNYEDNYNQFEIFILYKLKYCSFKGSTRNDSQELNSSLNQDNYHTRLNRDHSDLFSNEDLPNLDEAVDPVISSLLSTTGEVTTINEPATETDFVETTEAAEPNAESTSSENDHSILIAQHNPDFSIVGNDSIDFYDLNKGNPLIDLRIKLGSDELPRISCASHKLNLAVRGAMVKHKVICEHLRLINKFISGIKRSYELGRVFKDLNCRLRLENVTRWGSAFLCLESIKRAHNNGKKC